MRPNSEWVPPLRGEEFALKFEPITPDGPDEDFGMKYGEHYVVYPFKSGNVAKECYFQRLNRFGGQAQNVDATHQLVPNVSRIVGCGSEFSFTSSTYGVPIDLQILKTRKEICSRSFGTQPFWMVFDNSPRATSESEFGKK